MSKNYLSFNIILGDETTNEVRQIYVDASLATSYLFMKEKIEMVFPNLRKTKFKITWKDTDDNEVTIANDEDFMTAFTEMPGEVKVLTIRSVDSREETTIYCEGCGISLTGYIRYKCLQCPNFNLCGGCEFQELHPDHMMIRFPKNDSFSSRCARKFMRHISRNMKKVTNHTRKDAYRVTKRSSRYSAKCGKKEKHVATMTQLLKVEPQTRAKFEKTETMTCDMMNNADDTFCVSPAQNQYAPPRSGEKSSENGDVLIDADVSIEVPSIGTDASATASLYPPTANVVSIQSISKASSSQSGIVEESVSQSLWTFVPANPQQSDSNSKASFSKNGRVEESVCQPLWTFVSLNPQQPESNLKASSSQNGSVEELVCQPLWSFVPANPQQSESNSIALSSQNGSVEESVLQPLWPVVATNPQQSELNVQDPSTQNQIIDEGLLDLHEMGFPDDTGALRMLLEFFKGDVMEVVKAIFNSKIY